ncbi:MAG TPA: hypothetical protein VJS92_07055, partial [Candidatus Polarisedimenticolaceae bacterium]|nr:hypothetical protein [Candidatus Polarisedimenticolaceae bacterium]
MSWVLFLGPQRFRPTVAETLRRHGLGAGPVAAVTAGWQEREDEDGELRDHLGCETVNLELYGRHEEALGRDAELAAALRERQEQLQELQRLYRLRLSHALAAVRELEADPSTDAFAVEQRLGALRAVRALDRQHLLRLRRLHRAFAARWRPSERPAIAAHRRELAALLERCPIVAVAGGHVAVLLSRLRLFDLVALAARHAWVAWSAGAMVLA